MLKNQLLIALRSMMKNKLFIFINIFGMGVAIACCVVAYVNWNYSDSWDSSFGDTKSIYRVQFWREFQNSKERYGLAPMPLRNYVKQNFNAVSDVTRYHTAYCDMRIGDDVFGTQMAFVDSAFFNMFQYDLKYGTFPDFWDKSK